MIDVALLDTGISLNRFDNVNFLAENINLSDPEQVRPDTIRDNVMTHGTICASIIKTYAPQVRLHSFNIFTFGLTNLESIRKAIEICIRQNIKVINLSFGTNVRKEDIDVRKVIEEAYQKGIIMVAPTNNEGIVTYPAFYKNVLSVGVNNSLDLSGDEIAINKNPKWIINVFACGAQKLYKNNTIYTTENEPSYATAVVTAVVCNCLSGLEKRYNIKDILNLIVD